MYITFYKILSKEDYEKNKNSYYCREETYTPNLGDIQTHMHVSRCEDRKAAFANLGLDVNNYEFQSWSSNGINVYTKLNFIRTQEDYDKLNGDKVFRIINLENRNIVEIDDDDIPKYSEVEYLYYTQMVYNQKISWDDDESIFLELERIQDMINNQKVTKSRFEELLYHIPELHRIIYDYYKVPTDLDFDIFVIDW